MNPKISPSKLPMLAECPCFDASPFVGKAAEEGSRQHELLEALLKGTGDTQEESVKWAYRKIKELCDGRKIKSETYLQMPWGDRGKADAVCGSLLFDYKSGQKNDDYDIQMAAYALGMFNEDALVDDVTVFLLYGKDQEMQMKTFTKEEAEKIVLPVVASASAKTRKPKPCRYCKWCKDQTTCPALQMELSVALDEPQIPNLSDPSKITDPESMALMLAIADHAKEWAETVKVLMLEKVKAGAVIPGYKLMTRQGNVKCLDNKTAYEKVGLPLNSFLDAVNVSVQKLAEQKFGKKDKDCRVKLEALIAGCLERGDPAEWLERIKEKKQLDLL